MAIYFGVSLAYLISFNGTIKFLLQKFVKNLPCEYHENKSLTKLNRLTLSIHFGTMSVHLNFFILLFALDL